MKVEVETPTELQEYENVSDYRVEDGFLRILQSTQDGYTYHHQTLAIYAPGGWLSAKQVTDGSD
jgi:hypothetical protein